MKADFGICPEFLIFPMYAIIQCRISCLLVFLLKVLKLRIIFPVALYECESWFNALTEERSFEVFTHKLPIRMGKTA